MDASAPSVQFLDPDALFYPFNPPDVLHTESRLPWNNIDDPQALLMASVLEPKPFDTVMELDEHLDVQESDLSSSTAIYGTRDRRRVVHASNASKEALKGSIQSYPAPLSVRYDLSFLVS